MRHPEGCLVGPRVGPSEVSICVRVGLSLSLGVSVGLGVGVGILVLVGVREYGHGCVGDLHDPVDRPGVRSSHEVR